MGERDAGEGGGGTGQEYEGRGRLAPAMLEAPPFACKRVKLVDGQSQMTTSDVLTSCVLISHVLTSDVLNAGSGEDGVSKQTMRWQCSECRHHMHGARLREKPYSALEGKDCHEAFFARHTTAL